MTDITLTTPQPRWTNTLIVVAAAWLAVVIYLAAAGAFQVPPGEAPLGFFLGVAIPVGIMLVGYRVSPSLRSYVLSIDPVILNLMQSWRILGGLFLALYAFNQLPGLFAWPAGAGDMAIGIAAPFIVWALVKDPDAVLRSRYAAFHWLGMFDFVVAFATGIAARGEIAGWVKGATTAPMGDLPLALIPGFLVPIFLMLHIAALLQIRHRRAGLRG